MAGAMRRPQKLGLQDAAAMHLHTLPGPLVYGTVVSRPSKTNKSPYLADVELDDGKGTIVMAHTPGLGCGGLVAPSVKVRVLSERGVVYV